MSLTPDNQTDLLDEYLDAEASAQTEPALTYRINFDTGRLGGMVDEIDALKQFIVKSVITLRSHYRIYTDDFGCEVIGLIGSDVTKAYIQSEIPRMVREALVYDDRVDDVTDITATRQGDVVYITATVDSIYGSFTQEVMV